jgi:dextranase
VVRLRVNSEYLKIIKVFIILLVIMSSCNDKSQILENEEMQNSVNIDEVIFKKSFFCPGEMASWQVTVNAEKEETLLLVNKITHLDQILDVQKQKIRVTPDVTQYDFEWQPPKDSPMGYGLDIWVENDQGDVLAFVSTAFDVLEKWTQHPRYGFMVDFSPGRTDGDQTLDQLLPFRINALQFYDWMYRHDTYLPPQDPFIDPLRRHLSLETTQRLIDTAHERNMAAMPYTAVYAASISFYEQHPDWALLEKNGKPSFFGENFLVIMDPRPDSPWTKHLLSQFSDILTNTQFDGIHLDQYGAPKVGYDQEGNSYDLAQPLAALIDSTRQVVEESRRQSGAVVFNAVTNWPIEAVAPADQDIVYIEVWPPYTHFTDLGLLIQQAQTLGDGKPVVIAAYIHPAYETNALLNDAIIFANGAGHIELGEGGGYLADPYFPKYEVPSANLREKLERYYQFSIRYQNWLGPTTQAGNQQMVRIQGYETDAGITKNKIMPVVRESDGTTVISLINLMGLKHGEWEKELKSAPPLLSNLTVEIGSNGKEVEKIWFTSPDLGDITLKPLSFTQEGQTVNITIPTLNVWSLAIIEWKN